MKTFRKIGLTILLLAGAGTYLQMEVIYAGKAGCEVQIYVANNSRFDCRIEIDGVPQTGKMLPANVKIFKAELPNDKPKRIKMKVIYDDPDYLEPRSYFLLTHKLECGQIDTLYIAHTK